MKKILITFCLLFSTASFASYGLENLIYFSNEIVQAKFLWNECPFEKAFGPKKTCNPKLLVEEVHKGDASLVGKVVSIKNFHTFYMNFGQKVDDEVFLFVDTRTPANELTLVETVNHREFWNHCRYIVQDPGTKREVLEYIQKQKKPDYKRPSVASFYEVRGYLDNYKRADDIFVVEVLSSRSVGWRTIFTWPIFFGLSEYQMEVKFLVKEVLKGDKKLVGKEFAFYFFSIGQPPSYLREGKEEPGEYGCEKYPSYVKKKELIFPLKRENVVWNSSNTEVFAHWAFLYKYGYCPQGFIYKDNLAFRYRKQLVEEAETLDR